MHQDAANRAANIIYFEFIVKFMLFIVIFQNNKSVLVTYLFNYYEPF